MILKGAESEPGLAHNLHAHVEGFSGVLPPLPVEIGPRAEVRYWRKQRAESPGYSCMARPKRGGSMIAFYGSSGGKLFAKINPSGKA